MKWKRENGNINKRQKHQTKTVYNLKQIMK